MVERNTYIVGSIIIVIITIITLIILAIAGVFNPNPEPSNSVYPMYNERTMGLHDTTAKCRAKYPDYPLAFGNEVVNKRGCFSCPDGYVLRSSDLLDHKYSGGDENIRCIRAEYKPAKARKYKDKYILSCLDYQTDNDRIFNDNGFVGEKNTPWETIQPNACGIAKNDTIDYKSATYLGAV